MTSEPRSGLAIADNRLLRTVLLCLLYFAQGFPWGFATVALLSVLTEAGHAKAETAAIVSLAILPWTFKLVWAPMIDTYRWPALGLRRPWIIIAQTGMAITLFGVWGSGSFEEATTVSFIAWVFFAHNCFASLQDVATDALAVDLLDDAERGRVNGLMWGSKLLGTAVGSAGMASVIATAGVATAVLIQAVGIVVVLVLVVAVRERAGEKRFPWSPGSRQASPNVDASGGFVGVIRELGRALSLRATLLAGLVAVTANLTEGLYGPLTTELFVKEFGWTAVQFSHAQGIWGVIGELIGALLGGVLCDRFGRRLMATVGFAMTAATLILFSATSSYWTDASYPQVLLIPLFRGSMALATVSLFSLYMKISWTGAAACQFTLYMALANVGYRVGAGLNGLELTHAQFYLFAGVLALVPIAVLAFIRPETVVARKVAETPLSSSSPEG